MALLNEKERGYQMVCRNCGKEIGRGKWCSDRCRKFFRRKSDKVGMDVRAKSDKGEVGQGMDVRVLGPLDVYSEHRWEYLQAEGFEWDSGRGFAVRKSRAGEITALGEVIGVTILGDPAYYGNVIPEY